MKYVYMWALLLAPLGLRAQNAPYWPLFRPGLTYQLAEAATPADTTHTVRLSAQPTAGPDSVYALNWQFAQWRTATTSECSRRPNFLFGDRVRVPQAAARAGVYVLEGAAGRTLTLRLRHPLGQDWPATPTGLMARVTARGVVPVLGQPDSVVTIQLSDGQTVQCSKRYGWLAGPAPAAYLGRGRARRLTLSAAPVRNFPETVFGMRAIHNYQPGDVFLRHSQESTNFGSLCTESWQRDSVLTRTLSRTQDSVTYTIRTRTLRRAYGMASAPIQFCNQQAGTTLEPPRTLTLIVSASYAVGAYGNGVGNELTNGYLQYSPVTFGYYTGPAYRTSYNGRLGQKHEFLQPYRETAHPDSLWLSTIVDAGGRRQLAAGLGETSRESGSVYGCYQTQLLGYHKAPTTPGGPAEDWGSLRTFAQLLSSRPQAAAATTAAFPVPFQQQLTVRCQAARSQMATLTLFDGLGRQVATYARPARTGPNEWQLSTAHLPAGLYLLHLHYDNHTEALRVQKTE
ncbi:T9SS type A sorting domain-containing protein [Hymenobacter metallilatus]|uniref:T9SS C-terminal target domain-containing protein n=1 Tax=Hymenobacter metallilatus TaxID=2493666 RepID=A0A428JC83_9BACT|nr:T9SS type A sorting domain-containing protein [Hymenobacter metallilatus]RSK29527.1 T9SS C-terminal target domain-containing protein [Hymenobacter metallilatus]